MSYAFTLIGAPGAPAAVGAASRERGNKDIRKEGEKETTHSLDVKNVLRKKEANNEEEINYPLASICIFSFCCMLRLFRVVRSIDVNLFVISTCLMSDIILLCADIWLES